MKYLILMLISLPAYGFTVGETQWPTREVNLYVNVVHPEMGAYSPSGISWNQAVVEAAAMWAPWFTINIVPLYANPCFSGQAADGINTIGFIPDRCGGYPFDNALASALSTGYPVKTEVDITVNAAMAWDIYDGPLRPGVYDFRRVIAHEIGHLIGIEHSESGTLMLSYTSDVTAPSQDDIAGVLTAYGIKTKRWRFKWTQDEWKEKKKIRRKHLSKKAFRRWKRKQKELIVL